MASRRFTIGRLGLLLTLAFVGVAIAAISVFSVLSTRSGNRDIVNLMRQREGAIASGAAAAAGSAYRSQGWRPADIGPMFVLLARDGAQAQIRDVSGKAVVTSPGFGDAARVSGVVKPVFANGRQVGSISVRFAGSITSMAATFDTHRWQDRISAAGIASLLALAVALVLSRWITTPVESVILAMRARGEGDRNLRISEEAMRGLRVLRELPEGFNESVEALDARERAHRNLVADVAHELRTPVAILQATHEAMAEGVVEPTPQTLASLHDEVLRLAGRVEDLRQLASAESAALQLALVRHELAEIAGSAMSGLRDAYAAAGITLTSRLAPVDVLCDPERMRQVVINLLTNALKFTPAGGSVSVVTAVSGPESARLVVADTGIGISPDELPRVTERFFRGERATGMARGSGIGLTIVSELVRAHHGEVEFASHPGQGTEVTVRLPRAV